MVFFCLGNIYKDVKYLIKIEADEAAYLRENGQAFDVHMTSATHKSKAKKYYLTTSPRSMKLLDKYRKSKNYISYGG